MQPIRKMLSTMNKIVPVVQQFHQSRSNGEWTKALTISVLKQLYADFIEADTNGLLPLKNIVINIVKYICKHVGNCDTEAHLLFYNVWLKVVHDFTLSIEEKHIFQKVIGFIGKQQYKYLVIFETNGKYYHFHEYTFSNDNDNMALVAYVQDMHDHNNISGETFTTSNVSAESLLDFDKFIVDKFGRSAINANITTSIQFAMFPNGHERAYRSLTRYLKQKTILDYFVHSIKF